MTTLSSDAVQGETSHVSIADYLKTHVRDYGMLVALVVIMAFFQIWTNGVLLKPLNVTNLILQNSYIIIMALGMLLVIVCGHIDLSVGSVVGFIGALSAVMMVSYDIPVIVTVPACLITGALIGAAQGYWIAYWRIPSFVVTTASDRWRPPVRPRGRVRRAARSPLHGAWRGGRSPLSARCPPRRGGRSPLP